MNRTLAKVKKTEAEKEKGALDKYLSKSVDLFETEKSDKQVESDDIKTNISKEITSEASSSFLSGCNAQQNTSELCINISVNTHKDNEDISESREENSNPALCDILKIKDDPATWPNKINQNVRDYLVNKGPPKITVENFPQNEKGLHFSKFHFYCYYCKLLDTNSDSALATSGFDSWSNIHTRLEDHEKSKKHLQCTLNYYELQQRLSTGLTVDTLNEKLIR
ncbi:zinc finger MYM-type protein 5-like [Hydra vulgaris]|uniref:Zinc finger MYM-type protein 5-like n=1 Tax=Hydra vulgaris TaxID=6087 RepID=A0ABM4D0N7_HYDVU